MGMEAMTDAVYDEAMADLGAAIRCPESPQDLGLNEPEWWPGQRESIDLIMDAFVMQGKKYVMAAIPTGGGKTLIAAAVQKLLARSTSDFGGGKYGGNSLVLTHTIQLQGQYQRTLNNATVVTGRSNHLCELPSDSEFRLGVEPPDSLTAEDAPCTTCPIGLNTSDGCSYYRQFYAAADSPMTIMNYAYASRILQIPKFKGYAGNPFHRDLLVADECHLAESAIISAAGVKIWTARLSSAGINLPSLHTRIEVLEGGPRSQKTVRYENVRVWIMWAADTLVELNPLVKKARAAFDVSKTPTNRKALKKIEALWEALTFLAHGIHAPDEWVIRRDTVPGKSFPVSVTIQPLFGWTVAQPQLFRHFEKILLMSATPGDPDIARRHLGISEHDFTYIERPSTFPVANRPVIYWPIVKLNYQSDEQDWDKLARAIGFIATRPENVNRKGLVHSGSAANASRLVALLSRYLGERAFSHGDNHSYTREEALDEFIGSSDPKILVTASFTTGLDLPYVIGWQVIAKIPFGSLGDEITARRRAFKLPNGYPFGQKSYEAECANTVVQASGRINRTPPNCGPTYILDGNWDLVKSKAFLPKFFLDAHQRFVLV